MILAIIVFIIPLIGYAIFYYLIIKSARKDVLAWREQVRKETLIPLNAAIEDLQHSRERLEKFVSEQEGIEPIIEPLPSLQPVPSYNFTQYSPKKPRYPIKTALAPV